jgi:hypothetical protein
VCCADLNSFETSLPAPAPLEISGSVLPVHQQSPCTAAVTSAAAALFDQLSAPVADVAPAPPVTVQSQVLEAVTADDDYNLFEGRKWLECYIRDP